MRISRIMIYVLIANLSIMYGLLYLFSQSLGNEMIKTYLVSFPKLFVSSPLNLMQVMFILFWITPEMILFSYCFQYYTRYLNKISTYTLTRSKSMGKSQLFILRKILWILVSIEFLRYVILSITLNIGFYSFIKQIPPFLLSNLVLFIEIELICISYQRVRDDRLIVLFVLAHLLIIFGFIQGKIGLVNILLYNVDSNKIGMVFGVGLLIVMLLFNLLVRVARKVEY